MRRLLLPLAVCAGLAGCAGYGDLGYDVGWGTPGYTAGAGWGTPGFYGHPNYFWDSGPAFGPWGSPLAYGDRFGADWMAADFDRDGIRNRFDRDVDGDGVLNRFDDRPLNPHIA